MSLVKLASQVETLCNDAGRDFPASIRELVKMSEGVSELELFFQGGEPSGSIVNWGDGNIDADPNFIAPGYWDSNDTPGGEDDFWVEIDRWDSNFIAETFWNLHNIAIVSSVFCSLYPHKF